MVPTARTLQGQELETDVNMCAETRMVDLETMDETRDITRERVRRYRQQMSSMYKQNVHERIFVEGQLILRVAEGPYIMKEAHGSGYYRLCSMDEFVITEPINGKWLKLYHA